MLISIVIPAYNEEQLLGDSLAGVRAATEAFADRGWSSEVIVCNNNSTDRTGEVAEAAGARVIFEPINQIARARNTGASVAAGEWLIFLDADSIPDRELFARVAENIASARCIGGGCLITLDERHVFEANVAVAIWNWISRIQSWAAGSFIYCDASAFRELAGFSAQLYASEEIDFSRRLKRLGRIQKRSVRIIREPKLVTSARKMHLYTRKEHLIFMIKALFFPSKVLTNRESCSLWYDGRR